MISTCEKTENSAEEECITSLYGPVTSERRLKAFQKKYRKINLSQISCSGLRKSFLIMTINIIQVSLGNKFAISPVKSDFL
jgi:hypothetical protein